MWGWADIHCHPMAQAGFGELMHGHMHGPVEDLGSCMDQHGYMHQNLLKPASIILDGGRFNDGSLATSGWTTCPLARAPTTSWASAAGPRSTTRRTSRRTRTGSVAPTTAASG